MWAKVSYLIRGNGISKCISILIFVVALESNLSWSYVTTCSQKYAKYCYGWHFESSKWHLCQFQYYGYRKQTRNLRLVWSNWRKNFYKDPIFFEYDETEHILPCNVMFFDFRTSLGWTYLECVYKKLTLTNVFNRTFL